MELYIFDKALNRLGIIETYEYLSWRRRYSTAGDFELHAAADAQNLALLKQGFYLWKSGAEEAGIMENIELQMQEKETIVVSGRFATALLDRRIIWGTEILQGDLAVVVGQIIDKHALHPLNADRVLPWFQYFASTLNIPVNIQVSYQNLLKTVEELCTTFDVGLKTVLDPLEKRFTATLYIGSNSAAVFSKEYENLLEQTFTQSMQDYANVTLIGGEGEGGSRVLISLGNEAGMERREVFTDAKELKSIDFGTQYTTALGLKGSAMLAERAQVQSMEATINPYGNLRYKEDFDLGHLVMVTSKKWGVSLHTRIIEIEESYTTEGMELSIVFGRGLLTLSQKLRGG